MHLKAFSLCLEFCSVLLSTSAKLLHSALPVTGISWNTVLYFGRRVRKGLRLGVPIHPFHRYRALPRHRFCSKCHPMLSCQNLSSKSSASPNTLSPPFLPRHMFLLPRVLLLLNQVLFMRVLSQRVTGGFTLWTCLPGLRICCHLLLLPSPAPNGAHRALDSLTKVVEVDGGPSYRL
jgi:hypothetical protein